MNSDLSNSQLQQDIAGRRFSVSAKPKDTLRSAPLLRVASWLLAGAAVFAGTAVVAQQTASEGKSSAAPAAAPDTEERGNAYYHFGLAHMYEEMAMTTGRQEYAARAIEEYKLALNADPNSPFLNSGLAELYFRTGRVREAILAAQEILKKNPDDLSAHKLLGRIYLRSLGDAQNGASQQMLDLAIAEYKKIVTLQPNEVENHLLLGQLYSLNHDSSKAQEEFQAAQKIDPNSEDVALNLARIYDQAGDPKRAVETIKAVPPEDRSAKGDYTLGNLYDQMKDYKDSIAAYRDALDEESDDLDARRALASALLNDNQLDEALKVYRDIASADPQDAQTYVRIADIERRQGHYDQALSSIRKAKSLASESLDMGFNEALIYDSLGRYDEAAAVLQRLIKTVEKPDEKYSDAEKSDLAYFLERLATVYREQNKTALAIDAYQEEAALGGEYAERGYQGEVDAYRDAKEYAKATAVAREAAKKLPKNRTIQLMLALQLADTGNPEEGLKLAQAQLDGQPADDREVYLALAQMDTRLRRWKDANEDIDKADALSAKSDDRWYISFLRGELAERQKRYDVAEDEFRKVLAADPNNSMTLNYLGYMLADRGIKLNDALAMLQKAVQLDPQNYAYLDSLGWVYFKLGQYPLAEENLLKASERQTGDPTVHDHLGQLYEKTGRLKEAVNQWDKSLAEYARTVPADADPGDVTKVQKKLESAKMKLAREAGADGGEAKR